MTSPQARLRAIEKQIRSCEAALNRAQEAKYRFYRSYCKQHPLTAKQYDWLVARVAAGGALCCDEGRKFLLSTVPPIWAALINHWAYEALSCKGNSKNHGEDVAKVRLQLRRDVPPPGYHA